MGSGPYGWKDFEERAAMGRAWWDEAMNNATFEGGEDAQDEKAMDPPHLQWGALQYNNKGQRQKKWSQSQQSRQSRGHDFETMTRPAP